jgi:hypothetical protein
VHFLQAATLLKALGLDGPLTNATLAAAKHCGNRLRHLHMGITSGPVPVARPAAQTLHCTALHCTALHCTALHWSHYSVIAKATGLRVTKSSNSLPHSGVCSVSVARAKVISDAFLAAVPEHCPQLQEILLNKTSGYTASGSPA